MVDEFVAAGEGEHIHAAYLDAEDLAVRQDRDWFAGFVAEQVAMGEPDGVFAPDLVSCDQRWIERDGRLVGFMSIRHHLNAWLCDIGGHIGYSVRPTARRSGVVAAAFRLALRRCASLGIERAMVSCDPANLGSRATIVGGGGELARETTHQGRPTNIYWAPTLRADDALPAWSSAPLSLAPVRTPRAQLELITPDVVDLLLAGGREDSWAADYPRPDDVAAIALIDRNASVADAAWGPRQIRLTQPLGASAAGTVVGSIGCYGPPGTAGVPGEIEIGYGLVDAAQRQGLMSEIIDFFIRAAFAAGAQRAFAHTDSGNLASQAVLRYNSFTATGETNDAGEIQWARSAPAPLRSASTQGGAA